MNIRVIIFDQDETLIHPKTGLYDLYVLERAKDFAVRFGIDDIETAKELAFRMKIEECNDSTITLYDKMGIPRTIWYDKINAIDVRPFLERDITLKKLIKTLRTMGLFIFLLTNSPTIQTHKILESAGLNRFDFDHLFTWEREKEPPKPSKEPFEYICRTFGVLPQQCIMVGNEIGVDLSVAHSLGVHTVGINLETEPDQSVDFVIDTLDDVCTIIKTLEKRTL